MIYEFKLGQNTTEATKSICCEQDEGAVDHSNQMVQEILLVLQRSNNQAKSGRPKTMNSEDILQAIEANPASSTPSGKLGISLSSVVSHFHDLGKKHWRSAELCLILPKHCKTFDSTSIIRQKSFLFVCLSFHFLYISFWKFQNFKNFYWGVQFAIWFFY